MLRKAVDSLVGKSRDIKRHIAAADEQRDRRNWAESARLYRAVLDLDDSLDHVWVQYGHSLKESGDLAGAEIAYQKALTLADLADTHLQLGHLHKLMGRLREAEQDYLRAFDRQPNLKDARTELGNFNWNPARLRKRQNAAAPDQRKPTDSNLSIAFELSDLIDHLQRARYPTGIQRVQLCLAEAFLRDEEPPRFVYYEHISSRFYEVDAAQVHDIVEVVTNVARSDQARTEIVDRLKSSITTRPPYEFQQGEHLVNVGTSWGFLNYFLTVREAKRRFGIRYVPMIHDCIPLLFPEFCNPNLVCDFINWVSHMLVEADLILSNSENTRKDLAAVAAQMGVALPPVSILRLNGEYGKNDADPEEDLAAIELLRLNNLDVTDYVLFVSTIEPRKNHMLALNAWSNMLKKAPAGPVPKLVCVGSAGWMNDAFHERLERDKALGQSVVVLRDVSDQFLQLLYRRCMFTLFPSLYEGWGLPISEALAHGKVPLVSNVSSHPEAGGDLAVYFDLDSESDFRAKLAKLIEDEPARKTLEGKIARGQPLRPWREIGEEMLRGLQTLPPAEYKPVDAAPEILSGRYYGLMRNVQDRIGNIWFSGDPLRRGTGWHAPEPWGCWVRGQMGEIAFRLPEGAEDYEVFLRLMSSPNLANTITVAVPGGQWSSSADRQPGEEWWERVPVRLRPGSSRIMVLRLSGAVIDDFSIPTEGVDPRKASLGVKGLYVCPAGDPKLRQALTEAIVLNDFSEIARRFQRPALV